MALQNVKFGTFIDAERSCGSIWTPNFCTNKTLEMELHNLAVFIKDLTLKLEYPPELFDLRTMSYTAGFEQQTV